MFNLLGAYLPTWFTDFVRYTKPILLALIMVAAIALIVVVLCQESEEGGTNAITGIKDTYYSQNKGMNREGRLKKATIILAIFIAVTVLVFFILHTVSPSSLW